MKNFGPGGLGDYQKIFLEQRNNINILKINDKYYEKIFSKKIISNKNLNDFYSLFNSAEKLFCQIIEERRKRWEYLNISTIGNLDLDEFDKKIENSIKEFESFVTELKMKYSNINDRYTLYSKQKLHEIYFDNSDIFLDVIDN